MLDKQCWPFGLWAFSPSLLKFLSQDIVQSTTIKNTFVGTAEWMAPEAIACKNQTKPADIWSLGCTILEMTYADTPWSRNMEERRNGVFSALGMPFHWHTPKRLVGFVCDFFYQPLQKPGIEHCELRGMSTLLQRRRNAQVV